VSLSQGSLQRVSSSNPEVFVVKTIESTDYYPISEPLGSLESNQPGASKPQISC